jgi:hypothetical protein
LKSRDPVNDAIDGAMELMDKAGLPYPMVQVVAGFVLNALDPKLAVEYVTRACHEAGDLQQAMRELVSDWKHVLNSGKVYDQFDSCS